jgi:hypothetical protein
LFHHARFNCARVSHFSGHYDKALLRYVKVVRARLCSECDYVLRKDFSCMNLLYSGVRCTFGFGMMLVKLFNNGIQDIKFYFSFAVGRAVWKLFCDVKKA